MELQDRIGDFKIEDLLNSLFLPILKYDLDSVPIDDELFVNYQANVEEKLPLFFDFVKQHKQYITGNKKLHCSFILLLCELAPLTAYQIKNERLLKNLHRLLDEQQDLGAPVETLIFNYYRVKLKQDVWKRHLGAVHGFTHFLTHFFNGKSFDGKKLEGRWLNFSLAIAINIRDCHEMTYKQLGIEIFHVILKRAPPEFIRELNIHGVIYESVLKDVHSTDSEAVVTNIWDCLFLCLDFFDEIDSISWTKVDDLLEILVRNVPLTNNATMSVCLLDYFRKLCTFFTLNRLEIDEMVEATIVDSFDSEEFVNCRNVCVSNTSYTPFRWAKHFLHTIIFECHKLMSDENACLDLLTAMYKCYLVVILPIPVPIAKPHLIVFYEKFTAVLMEAIVVHKKQAALIKASTSFVKTFIWQLKLPNSTAVDTTLAYYQAALEELMLLLEKR